MDVHKELAKRFLKKHIVKYDVTFRGVPILEFDKEELAKIIYILSNLVKEKDKTIGLLSRI